MQELQCQRPQKLDSVRLMERYVELGGKQMSRSTIIKFICKNVENQVVLSERRNRLVVFFRDSNIVTLNIIKDDYAVDNLEAVLDVVTTHIKKECSVMEYKNWSYSTKISKYRRRIWAAVVKSHVLPCTPRGVAAKQMKSVPQYSPTTEGSKIAITYSN